MEILSKDRLRIWTEDVSTTIHPPAKFCLTWKLRQTLPYKFCSQLDSGRGRRAFNETSFTAAFRPWLLRLICARDAYVWQKQVRVQLPRCLRSSVSDLHRGNNRALPLGLPRPQGESSLMVYLTSWCYISLSHSLFHSLLLTVSLQFMSGLSPPIFAVFSYGRRCAST